MKNRMEGLFRPVAWARFDDYGSPEHVIEGEAKPTEDDVKHAHKYVPLFRALDSNADDMDVFFHMVHLMKEGKPLNEEQQTLVIQALAHLYGMGRKQ